MLCYTNIIGGFVFLQIALAVSNFKPISTTVYSLRLSTESTCQGEEVGKFVKDPYACDKFYYCGADETAVVVYCPHGMIFNDQKEICDFPSNYLCIPRIKEDEDGVQTTSPMLQTTAFTEKEIEENFSATSTELQTTLSIVSTTTTMMTTTTKTTKTTIKSEVETHCPLNDTKTLMFLHHPYECHRYYICYHGVPVAQECISELHWNPQTNRCDFPENSGCLATTVVPSTVAVSVAGTINCPFKGQQIFPHPVHCNFFIYCINGYATVQQCPFYHHFDVRKRRCLWKTVATCSCMIGKKQHNFF